MENPMVMRKVTGIIIALLSATLFANAQSGTDRNKVMEYLQEQQYEEAISYLLPVINKNDPRDLSLLAYTWYQSGKLPEAAATYEKVLALDSTHLSSLQYLATIRMQQDAPLQAIPLFRRITQLRPGNAPAWKQLSFAAFTALQPDSGFVWLQKAWQLNPADPKVVSRLAEEWIERKNYLRADSLVTAFLKNDSLQTTVLMTAARTSFLVKDFSRTAAIGDQLRSLHVISPNTFVYITAACYNIKKYADCISIYDYMLAGNAASENITYYAAISNTALGKYKESNELLQLCITMAKSASLENYYNSVSVNYEQLRQFKPAIAYMDTSWYLSHKPVRQYSIGRMYETGLKNEAAAIKYYKRYLQLYNAGSAEEKDIYRYLRSRINDKQVAAGK